MNISHKHKYLYFVVPKCASKTIRLSLGQYTDIGYPKPSPLGQHITINDFFKSNYFDLFEQYFKFTFVRNPYEKLYSSFMQDIHAWQSYKIWHSVKKDIFLSIGENFNRYMQEYVYESDIKSDWDYIHFCPMHEFATIDNELCLDWFGKAENIENDLQELSKLLNLDIKKHQDANIRSKPSTNVKYLDKYTRETITLVNEIYSKDFELFSYPMLDPKDFPDTL